MCKVRTNLAKQKGGVIKVQKSYWQHTQNHRVV